MVDCIEEGRDDLPGDGQILALIHIDNHLPLLSHLVQPLGITNVDKVEHVLLKVRSAKSNGGIQKLRPDPGVSSNGVGGGGWCGGGGGGLHLTAL